MAHKAHGPADTLRTHQSGKEFTYLQQLSVCSDDTEGSGNLHKSDHMLLYFKDGKTSLGQRNKTYYFISLRY